MDVQTAILSARVKKLHWEPGSGSIKLELETGQVDGSKVTEMVAVLGKDSLVHLVPAQPSFFQDCAHEETSMLLGGGERVCLKCGQIIQRTDG